MNISKNTIWIIVLGVSTVAITTGGVFAATCGPPCNVMSGDLTVTDGTIFVERTDG